MFKIFKRKKKQENTSDESPVEKPLHEELTPSAPNETQHQEPGVDQQEPGVDQQEPGVDQQEPAVDQQASAVDQQEPAVDQQEPAVDQQEPAVDQQDPAVDQQEPAVDQQEPAVDQQEPAKAQPLPPSDASPNQKTQEPIAQKTSLFQRFRQGLKRTRGQLGEGLARVVLGKKQIDEDLLEEIETQLLVADVGVEATQAIIQELTTMVKRRQTTDGNALYQALRQQLSGFLEPVSKPLVTHKRDGKPFVILMVGINGAGKTTTIGKIAKHLEQQGKKVMLAAGDTFRAAAVEQLQVWGERNRIPVIAQHTGADSASVIYDAMQAATSRGFDVLIADTAGRLHTQSNLMQELQKVVRVIKKLDENAPHELMLVLDAGIGQNALNQAREFNQAINLTGITMTKLDGTAKGGILFAIAKQLGIPFRFIGVGEGIDDLRPFEANQFVSALFDDDSDLSQCE